MAGHVEEPSLLDHRERLGPFSNNNRSAAMVNNFYNPDLTDREATLTVPMYTSSTDPLSTLESLDLEDDAVSGSEDRLASTVDHLGSPVSTVHVEASNQVVNSDPLSSLDHFEEIDTKESFAEISEPHHRQPTANSELSAPDYNSRSLAFEENKNQPNAIVDFPPKRRDVNTELRENTMTTKPVPNYMSVHRKQPKRSKMSLDTDERITPAPVLLQEMSGLSNTNQSNQGLATLGYMYIEDGYSTISKYREDGEDDEDEGTDQQLQGATGRQSDAILREHKNPGSDSSDSTTRYSSCTSGIEISTSRQKLLRDDKVRFGTLDPRKLEDVTPSKFVNGRYVNPWDTWTDPTLTNGIKWMCMRNQGGLPPKEILDQTLPVLTPDLVRIRTPPTSGINVTWIGHASLLVQFDGVSILTDPIFSSFCGPMSLVGVKRYRPAPCDIHMLPKIHAVVISHSHYDHLDLPTVVALNNWYGSALRWFVPLGLMDWFIKTGVENVIELDWWQENCIPSHSNVTFAFTPSQHWSQRTAFDKQKCLWGSWSVIGPNHSFFFAGDTGYCKAFKEIGQRYGPFDMAAIPIGAYLPRFFLSPQHVDPAQAVQIHVDVQARQSVAIHWGTFQLGKENYLAPREDLKIALDNEGLSENDFFTMKHGETRLLAAEDGPIPGNF